MKQKSVGLTLRALILALVLSLVAGSPALPPLEGVAYAQGSGSGLTATVGPDGDDVALSWTAVTNADSYEILRGVTDDNNVTDWDDSILATVNAPDTTHTDDTVTAGVRYSYAVRSVSGTTTAPYTGPYPTVTIPGGTAAPTAAPTLTAAADGNSAIDVSWTDVTGATSYRLEYWRSDWDPAAGDDWTTIDDATQSPYKHTGLDPGITYYYNVRGVNAGGEGPPSNWRTGGSVALQATTTVPVLTLTRVDRTTVDISWTSTGSGAEYDLQRRKVHVTVGSDGTAGTADDETVTSEWARLPSALLTTRTHRDSGANYIPTDAVSVKYEYRVQAVDTQAWSTVKSITVPKLGAVVGTPGNVRVASLSDSSIRISWGAVTGADFYQIQWKTGTTGYTSPTRVDALFYEHTGLSPSTRYTYQVRAVDVNGAGDWSSESSSSTRSVGSTGLQVPKVTGLVVTDATSNQAAVPRSAKLTWNAVSDATHYDIQRYDPTSATGWEVVDSSPTAPVVNVGGATRIVKPSSSPPSYTDTFDTGAHGNTYFYVVSAVKQVGDTAAPATDEMGGWSDYKSFTFKSLPPPAPTALTAQMTSGTSIWLSWTAGTPASTGDPPTDPATSYTLEWRTDDTSTWSGIPVSGRMTYHHTGLSGTSAYRYRVRAENTGGSSDNFPEGTDGVRLELGNRLSPPGGLTAVDASTDGPSATDYTDDVFRIKVSWNAVSGASGYEIQRFGDDNMWGDLADVASTADAEMVTEVSGTEVIDDNDDDPSANTDSTGDLAANTTYVYRVRTVKGDTKSSWSALVSGTTREALVAANNPTLVAASTGMSMIRLSWTAVPGATNYELRFVEGSQTAANIDLIDPTPMTLSGSHRNYVHRNLKAGQVYSYQVRALIGANVMTIWSPVAQQITKPAAPDLSATNVTASSITLRWSATSFNGGRLAAAENYHIQRRTSGGDWESVILTGGDNNSGNAVSCQNNVCTLLDDGVDGDDTDSVDDGLTKGTTYFYRIRATATATPTGGAETIYVSYWDYISQTTPSQ